jgi:hypothetical protein
MNKTFLLGTLSLFLFFAAKSNPGDTTIVKKKYFTKRLAGSITLDGIPNEEVWNAVEWEAILPSFNQMEESHHHNQQVLKFYTTTNFFTSHIAAMMYRLILLSNAWADGMNFPVIG